MKQLQNLKNEDTKNDFKKLYAGFTKCFLYHFVTLLMNKVK